MQLEKTKEIDATMRDINQLICKPINQCIFLVCNKSLGICMHDNDLAAVAAIATTY